MKPCFVGLVLLLAGCVAAPEQEPSQTHICEVNPLDMVECREVE
mgnify:FL=1